jgi:hypothetical protein
MRFAPLRFAALVLALGLLGPAARPAEAGDTPVPVVVELFTAEGCSACPPADALLERLAREQPVRGAEVVALELHVDYFDRPGAVDPFAQASFGARQAEYMRVFGKRGAYTPQMVVDGQRELVGSREREARDAIADGAAATKAKVRLLWARDRLGIDVEGLAEAGAKEAADLLLAVAEDGISGTDNRMARGGVHAPIVRDLRKVASVSGANGPAHLKDVEVKIDGAWRRENLRAVAFVQRPRTLEIIGAGAVSLR